MRLIVFNDLYRTAESFALPLARVEIGDVDVILDNIGGREFKVCIGRRLTEPNLFP